MISEAVNLSTGPVALSPQVRHALQELPISHRSAAFRQLYDQATRFLSDAFSVNETYLLTGSGTLANEVMLQEIKYVSGRGLILSNGEFGNRLIVQAQRNGLNFITYQMEWGKEFGIAEIAGLLKNNSIQWVLFCHCETSTGITNDLDGITALAKEYHCPCFVDCMSTVGVRPLNLSGVAMATASSGKGLASIPGLAIVFSNRTPVSNKEVPIYLDISHYIQKDGVPFTLPSNLVKALYVSICQKLQKEQYELVAEYRKLFFKQLQGHSLVLFGNASSGVFTISGPQTGNGRFIKHMSQRGVVLSYESDYLKSRGWCQLATFGYYTERELKLALSSLASVEVRAMITGA